PIEPVWWIGRATGDLSLALTGIEPAKHLAAHLEGRDYLLGHRDCRAATRISPRACAAPLGREHAKPTQFNPLQCGCDGVEDRVAVVLHCPPIQVGVPLGEFLNQFGLDYRSLERSTRTGKQKARRTGAEVGLEMPADSAGSSTLPCPSTAAT